MIIADPHRLLSPGLTWTSTSSKEGNVRYPWASVTRLHCTDPKRQEFMYELIFCTLSLNIFELSPRNPNESKQYIPINSHELNLLQQYTVITKTPLSLIAHTSFPPPSLFLLLLNTHIYTDTCTNSWAVGLRGRGRSFVSICSDDSLSEAGGVEWEQVVEAGFVKRPQ